MGFLESYDAAASRWPAGHSSLEVDTGWGRTHLLAAGPEEAPAVVLLHGDGATSTSWADLAGVLAGRFRVLAPDQPGNPGRSLSRRPFRSTADMVAWLGELQAASGPDPWHLVGHSAGAHLALSYALAHPDRLTGLSLLDPTLCFAGLSPRYVLRALPMLLRPTEARVRRFLAWETGGRPLPPAWEHVYVRGATEFDRTPIVRTRRPGRGELTALRVPTLVVLARRSRSHRVSRVAGNAAAVPTVTVAGVATATHHTMPVLDAPEIAALVARHVDRPVTPPVV